MQKVTKFATQKDGVFAVMMAVLEKFGSTYDATIDYSKSITKPMKTEAITFLVEQFEAGNIPLDRPQGDKLHQYCSGLLNNWLRRDKRLNGNVEYVGKVGNSDPQIREARKLLTSGKITDPVVIARIESTIEKLVAEKRKDVEIDVSKLPEELKGFVA